MTFTDDDLKRLKEEAEKCSDPCFLALIARLEAAENCLSSKANVGHIHMPTISEWEAWRKAAGK